MTLWARVPVIILLPVAIFFAGTFLMGWLSNGKYIEKRLQQLPDCKDRVPLNRRLLGYNAEALARHWKALDSAALKDQRRALEVDLVFPLVYGAAFLSSFLLAWVTIGRPFHFWWLMAPIVITILADWTENSFLLGQLRDFMNGEPLSGFYVHLASTGTTVKLVFFSGMLLFALVLGVWAAVRPANEY
jgi:hypothetical protein